MTPKQSLRASEVSLYILHLFPLLLRLLRLIEHLEDLGEIALFVAHHGNNWLPVGHDASFFIHLTRSLRRSIPSAPH